MLEDMSLSFPAGKRVGLVGASGSGKSTLIKMLAGLYSPDSGAILVDGKDIQSGLPSWRAGIGYVPRGIHLPGIYPRKHRVRRLKWPGRS